MNLCVKAYFKSLNLSYYGNVRFLIRGLEMDIILLYTVIIIILFFYYTKKVKQLKNDNNILEMKLDEKESELNSLMNLYDDNVIASKTDLRGRITYASRGFCRTSEYSEEELVGQPHNIVKHPHASKKVFRSLWKDLRDDKVWKGEMYNLSKSGKGYWVETIISPEFDYHGNKIGYSSVRHDITAQKKLEDMTLTLEKKVKDRTRELEELSITDSLTNLYNRRYFETIFEQELKRAKRDKINFVFSIFDVDMFKQYNDNYGHIRGDEALVKISDTLKNLTKRSTDFAFRIGGEEFCLITSSMSEKEAVLFFNKIKKAIEELQIPHEMSSVNPYVTASFGLVVVDFNKMTHTIFDERYENDNIHKLADKLLYEAKDNGRNCIVHEVI